jgi:hypothetical protein
LPTPWYSVGLVVRTDKASGAIKSWKGLWKPELQPALKGRVMLANITGALTWGEAQIDSLVFMKPEMVVRERAGWVTMWNRMIATK